VTIGEALREGAARLRRGGVPRARLEAGVLLGHLLGADRARLAAHPERDVPADAWSRFAGLIERRAGGEPTAYLLGRREFWSLEFVVDPRVLIPRPESEHVVEVALRTMRDSAPEWIADVGTGSGCLALALGSEWPAARLIGIDLDMGALDVARENARRLGMAARFHAIRGRSLAPLARQRRLDLVVANPPYIRDDEIPDLAVEVRAHEPRLALASGPTGLESYRELIPQARARLRAAGCLVLEVDPRRAGAVHAELLDAPGDWLDVEVSEDLSGRARVVSARRSGRA
jgi:release factor glutamine methyltransferase